MRPTREQWAMNLVKATAQRSTCIRRQVGCVLLNKRGFVLATGYNGVASGMLHCNEVRHEQVSDGVLYGTTRPYHHHDVDVFPHACPGAQSPSGTNLDGCEAIHAEQNALLQCRDVHEIDGCYVSCSPCMTCIKLLLNTSCRKIYFAELYTQSESLNLWRRAGREAILIGETVK